MPYNPQDARYFLNTVYPAGKALPDEVIEVRPIPDGGGPVLPRFFSWDQRDELMDLAEVLDETHDIFIGPATRIAGAGGRKGALRRVAVVWADIDRYDVDVELEALHALPCPPSFVVFSGQGLHAYWRLRQWMELRSEKSRGAFERLLTGVRSVVAGDAVADATRMMRLPGTRNHKPGAGRAQILCVDIGG